MNSWLFIDGFYLILAKKYENYRLVIESYEVEIASHKSTQDWIGESNWLAAYSN